MRIAGCRTVIDHLKPSARGHQGNSSGHLRKSSERFRALGRGSPKAPRQYQDRAVVPKSDSLRSILIAI